MQRGEPLQPGHTVCEMIRGLLSRLAEGDSLFFPEVEGLIHKMFRNTAEPILKAQTPFKRMNITAAITRPAYNGRQNAAVHLKGERKGCLLVSVTNMVQVIWGNFVNYALFS